MIISPFLRALALTTLLLASVQALAVQRLDADTEEALRITASLDDSNVVSISGGSIATAWGTEDRVTLDKDEDSQQVIFRPVSDKPFTLFVQSESGATYTLMVTPKRGLIGQVIVINEFDSVNDEIAGQRGLGIVAYKQKVKRLLKELERSRRAAPRLRGFRLRMVNKQVPLWRETRIVHALQWRRGDLVIDRYIVTNVSDQVLQINEREFRGLGPGIRAIAARKLNLDPAESTVLYAVGDGS